MRIERYEYGTGGTFGNLFLGNGTVLHTLERPWADNAPFLSCIPEGIYALVRHEGQKYPDTWALIGGTVGHLESDGKPRWACVFHVGNWVSDTTGCVLVGVGRDGDMLTGSQEAMGLLREIMNSHLVLPEVMIVNTSGSVGTGPALDLEEPDLLRVLAAAPPALTPEQENTMKSLFKSKTLWFNVIGGALGAFLTSLQGLQTAGIDSQSVVITLAVGNFILRFLTKEPVALPGSK
jgi:hypothetical protein